MEKFWMDMAEMDGMAVIVLNCFTINHIVNVL